MNAQASKIKLFEHHTAPAIHEVQCFFQRNGLPLEEADHFYHVQEFRNWRKCGKSFIKNWRKLAYRWIVIALKDAAQPLAA